MALLGTVILPQPAVPASSAPSIYGPKIFEHRTASPVRTLRRFAAETPGIYKLEVYNGGRRGRYGLASGTIRLNGIQVVSASELGPDKPRIIQKNVRVERWNRLVVTTSGGRILLEIGRGGLMVTPPEISARISPPPNASGWNRTDVTVAFECSGGGGISSCTGPITVSSEGANQTFTGTAVGLNGLSASTTAIVNLDKTPPAVTSTVSPAANAAGWHRSEVRVGFAAVDGLSGVASVTPEQTLGADGADQPVTGSAIDVAGNSASATAVVDIDRTPPVVTALASPPANAAGWNSSGVTVSFSATDALSGVDSVSPPEDVANEGTNQVVTGQAVDVAGNTGVGALAVSIDMTPPTVEVTSPQDDASISGNEVTVTGSVFDSLSGVMSATLNGEPLALETSGLFSQVAGDLSDGANRLIVAARDLAGNDAQPVGPTVEADIPEIFLEVISPQQPPEGGPPCPGSDIAPCPPLVYNSGWPLTLRISFLDDAVGVGIDGFTVPQGNEHDRGPLPGLYRTPQPGPSPSRSEPQGYPTDLPAAGDTGFVVLEDPDTCPSFIASDGESYYQRIDTLDRCDVANPQDEQGNESTEGTIGEIVPCGSPCEDGFEMPCPYGTCTGENCPRLVRCPDESVVRFTLGTELGAAGLPGLLLLSDVGPGRWVDDAGQLAGWKNLADWDSVGYVLDAGGRTSLTAHMNVVFGEFAPKVEYDDSAGPSYRIDGSVDCEFGVARDGCPLPGTQPIFNSVDADCHPECLTADLQAEGFCGPEAPYGPPPYHSPPACFPRQGNDCDRFSPCFDARMSCVYIPVFERVMTIRAFLVSLHPFYRQPAHQHGPALRSGHGQDGGAFEGAVHMVPDVGERGVLDRADVEEEHEILAEATIVVQQAFGAGCHRELPPGGSRAPDPDDENYLLLLRGRPPVENLGLMTILTPLHESTRPFCPPFASSPVRVTRPRR